MPSTLTEAASFVSTVTVPNDGEGVTAASVRDAVSPVANRTQSLKADIHTTGVPRLRSVADLTALAALAGMSDGAVYVVPGVGVYLYNAGSSAASSSPWVIVPGGGVGRWFHELASIRGVNLATVSGGYVLEPVPNRIVSVTSTQSGSTAILYSPTNATFVYYGVHDVPDTMVGDIITVTASFHLQSGGTSATVANAILAVTDDAMSGTPTQTVHDETRRRVTGPTLTPITMTMRHVVTDGAPGTSRVQVGLASDGTYSAILRGEWSVVATLVRP